MRIKESNEFMKSLGEVLMKRATWYSIDKCDRIDLLAKLANADIETCVEKFLSIDRFDEFVHMILSFSSKINTMSLGKMEIEDAQLLEDFQNGILEVFNRPLGDVIEETIPYAIAPVDYPEDNFYTQIKELEKLI